MALDGAFLYHIGNELNEKLEAGRVDKIYQPNKEEIVLTIRTRENTYRLLLSGRANSARVHIMEGSLENPKQPPMLCMLLRKKLSGARLLSISQPELERVLSFAFDAVNELGDHITLTLQMEVMGKYSNIILLDQDGRIIDALKRVDAETSSHRLVLPGVQYELPPQQDKCNLFTTPPKEFVNQLMKIPSNMELHRAILNTLQGVSPIVCRELQHQVGRGKEVFLHDMDDEQKFRVSFFYGRLREMLEKKEGKPYVVIDKTGKPIDFSFMEIHQYGPTTMIVREEDSFSTLLDQFYLKRDFIERMKVKEQDLLRLLSSASERIARKLENQREELAASKDRDHMRIAADLISANAHTIEKGSSSVTLSNFYDEEMSDIVLKLDPALSPSQNAQKYYKQYRKAKTAQEALSNQIEIGERELNYLDSVLETLARAQNEDDIAEIRAELMETGYIRRQKTKKERYPAVGKPLNFTVDGFQVLVGRNNRQNDQLTLKTASKTDIWFHVKDMPGSHTVLLTAGQTPDQETLVRAAALAAKYSRASNSSNVPVDYTFIKHVSKPSGAKPGMVIYVNNKTLYVNPAN